MNEERTYRLIVSGGGTGGHIYPAVAIANEFRSQFPNAKILFVGANGRMEMTKVPEAGYEIMGLNIAGLQRRLTFKNLSFPFKLIASIMKARKIIRDFKPDAIIGTGGYASGPTVIAANRKNLPVLIQEQNSYPGLTNRRLGRKARKVCVAYPGMEKYFDAEKLVLTGNPVRSDINLLQNKREEGFSYFKLSNRMPTLLVLGGSLGARTINESMINGLEKLKGAGIQVIWQTGKYYYQEMIDRAGFEHDHNILITQFIDRMDLAYAVADLAISRAGALSISELCIAGLPVIFVPSPNVAEDHQTKNAMSLVGQDAAWLVSDKDAPENLVYKALELAIDNAAREKLSVNIRAFAKPNASKEIVNQLKLIMN